MNHAKPGFIIPLTLMLISMAVFFVTMIYQRGSVFSPLMHTMMNRERAKVLALNGIEIAMAQLADTGSTQGEQKDVVPKAGQKTADPQKEFLKNILPTLNRWQEFSLKEARDGIDGVIKISISCEAGKIDLNKICDFSKRLFAPIIISGKGVRGNWEPLMELIFGRVQKMTPGTKNLFTAFQTILKKRTSFFNDASELILAEEFAPFATQLFYEPPSGKMVEGKKRPLYLMDIFTVYGESTIQPWMFSDSMLGILGIPRAQAGDTKARPASVNEWLARWTATTPWQTQWNTVLKPVYGLELQSLPNGLDSVLQERFDPRFFSVVSYGVVGDVTQRAYGIIEREKSTVQGKERYECKLRKFYWI